MTTALKKQESKIINAFAKNVDVLRTVLPSHVTPEKLMRILSQEIRRNPAIAGCSMTSILSAVIQGSIYGLEIGSIKGHAYLVPYGKECTLVVGYKGFVWLALNSREVTKIESRAVFDGDDFTYAYGLEPYIVHHPGPANTTNFENLTHVYSIAWLANGEKQFDVMTRDEVLRIRDDKSKAKGGPWKTDPIEMAKKCPIRRLAKLLPLQLLQDVAQFDEAGDRGDQESLTDFLDAEYEILDEDQPPAPKGNEAGKAALEQQAKKRSGGTAFPGSNQADSSATQQTAPGQPPGDGGRPPAEYVDPAHDTATDPIPPPPDAEPGLFEAFEIQLSECEKKVDIDQFLARVAANTDLADDAREELEKRAHARIHQLTKGN